MDLPASLAWGSMSTNKRASLIRNCLDVIGDPLSVHCDPINYGRSVQLIYEAFASGGWDGTGGQATVKHAIGKRRGTLLSLLYAQWQAAPDWRL
jgi:hypothetical protein